MIVHTCFTCSIREQSNGNKRVRVLVSPRSANLQILGVPTVAHPLSLSNPSSTITNTLRL
jgi:hypothetical protein